MNRQPDETLEITYRGKTIRFDGFQNVTLRDAFMQVAYDSALCYAADWLTGWQLVYGDALYAYNFLHFTTIFPQGKEPKCLSRHWREAIEKKCK